MALQRKIPYLVYFLFSVFNGSDTTFFFELSYEISFDYQADKAVDLGWEPLKTMRKSAVYEKFAKRERQNPYKSGN